jgi:endonuclease YncB( thermonuclease family)
VKKKTIKSSVRKRIGAVAVASALVVGTYFTISFGKGKPFFAPAYQVLRVIDGDTFETTDKQRIRVASTQAPELNQCGWKEAKTELEKLIMDKQVYLKVIYRDPYQRLVSLVYVDNSFVNEEMLVGGYAYYLRPVQGEIGETLKIAADKARQKKTGIFSDSCTQMVNKEKPACNVKGNTRNGNIYYVPKCGVYDNVEVQLYLGDRWFCSEKEAVKSGFRKPEQCP